MKRIITAVLLCAVLLTVLAACGGKEEPSVQPQEPQPSSVQGTDDIQTVTEPEESQADRTTVPDKGQSKPTDAKQDQTTDGQTGSEKPDSTPVESETGRSSEGTLQGGGGNADDGYGSIYMPDIDI